MHAWFAVIFSQEIYTRVDQFIYIGSQLQGWQLFQLPIYRHYPAAFPCCKTFPLVFLLKIQNLDPVLQQTRHKLRNCYSNQNHQNSSLSITVTDITILRPTNMETL